MTRVKKSYYTCNFQKPEKTPKTALLSQGVRKGKKTKLDQQYDPAMLDDFSRYHTGIYAQYRFKVSSNHLVVIVSQYGLDINDKNQEYSIGTIQPLNLNTNLMYALADQLATDIKTFTRQCIDFASKHTTTGDRIPSKPKTKNFSGNNWRLKLVK